MPAAAFNERRGFTGRVKQFGLTQVHRCERAGLRAEGKTVGEEFVVEQNGAAVSTVAPRLDDERGRSEELPRPS